MRDIALALGGGGMRGIAHIGVFRKLEQEGFNIQAVSGTSVGGIMGAAYAAGFSPDEIVALMSEVDQSRLFRRGPNDGPGFMGIQGLSDALSQWWGDLTFDNLKIPFAVTATDINTGKEVILSQGRVLDAVLATSSLPGIFPPVIIDSTTLVDGGILDPVPVSVARWLAPELPVVAVCLTPNDGNLSPLPLQIPVTGSIQLSLLGQLSRFRWGQALQIFSQAIDAEARMLAELRLQIERPDVIIRPEVGNYGILDSVNINELIEIGEQAADISLTEIQHALSWGKQIARRFERYKQPGDILENES
jgi:NTE family protein